MDCSRSSFNSSVRATAPACLHAPAASRMRKATFSVEYDTERTSLFKMLWRNRGRMEGFVHTTDSMIFALTLVAFSGVDLVK